MEESEAFLALCLQCQGDARHLGSRRHNASPSAQHEDPNWHGTIVSIHVRRSCEHGEKRVERPRNIGWGRKGGRARDRRVQVVRDLISTTDGSVEEAKRLTPKPAQLQFHPAVFYENRIKICCVSVFFSCCAIEISESATGREKPRTQKLLRYELIVLCL